MFHGHGFRQIAVQHGERVERTEKRLFQFFLLVGNHSSVVLLGTRTGCRDDGSHRDEIGRQPVMYIPHVPDILVRQSLCRYNLAAVYDRASADSQNEVDIVFADDPCPFLYLGVSRIRHDAAEISHLFAALREPRLYFVIQSRAFDGTSAVGQQNIRSRLSKFAFYRLFGASFTEILSDGIVIFKIIHIQIFQSS